MRLPIDVVEGGERLYVHPFSVSAPGSYNNVCYLKGNEGLPYDNEWIIRLDNPPIYVPMGVWKRIWHVVIARFFVALYRWISFQWEMRHLSWWPDFQSFHIHFDSATPFVAASFPDLRLKIKRQLMLAYEERIVEEVYLTPSQQWIEKQLVDAQTQHDYAAFDAWRKEELAKGREIHYLVSIDT